MIIKGKVHCFFEQTGTFKNEFVKLGIPAEDYDIQDNFGQTDHVIDLFHEIDSAYDGKASVFDAVTNDDFIMAFFPCIYFCEASQCAFRLWNRNYTTWHDTRKIAAILEREQKRSQFYRLLVKLVGVCLERGIRIVVENPWNGAGYLKNNFLKDPDLVDRNRALRGDNLKKPTAYWFFSCSPSHAISMQPCKDVRKIRELKSAARAGLCSVDRSMINKNYARNFICDFILGGRQTGVPQQLDMFDESNDAARSAIKPIFNKAEFDKAVSGPSAWDSVEDPVAEIRRMRGERKPDAAAKG